MIALCRYFLDGRARPHRYRTATRRISLTNAYPAEKSPDCREIGTLDIFH